MRGELNQIDQIPTINSDDAHATADDNNEPPLKRRAVLYEEEKPVKSDVTALKFFLGTSEQSKKHKQESREKELACYLIEPPIAAEENPLIWWQNDALCFPKLSQIAAKYLSLLGVSVAAERVFSTAGHIISRTRSSLEPETADKLIFLSKNKVFM